MAYTTINKSTEHFNTLTYTGTGSSSTKTGVGFQPDLTWVKARDNTTWHYLYDAVRGAGNNTEIHSNSGQAEGLSGSSTYGYLSAFTSDGFSTVMGSNTGTDGFNKSGTDFVAWNWKAGDSNTSVSASGSGNGAINACTYRANTTAGFSIVKYTGRNSDISNGQETKVAHGLGVKPDFIIIKRLDGSSIEWVVRASFTPLKSDYHLSLNLNNARTGSYYVGNGDNDDATHFVVGNSGRTNENGNEFIAYVFSSKTGFSKFGTYTGNGSSDGTFVYTGFKPAFVMIKHTNGTSNWTINDTGRDPTNVNNLRLFPNQNVAESSGSDSMDMLSNGFKLRSTDGGNNGSGDTYIYMAFGQSLIGSNNVPCTAR
jgi:hypothetical protein